MADIELETRHRTPIFGGYLKKRCIYRCKVSGDKLTTYGLFYTADDMRRARDCAGSEAAVTMIAIEAGLLLAELRARA